MAPAAPLHEASIGRSEWGSVRVRGRGRRGARRRRGSVEEVRPRAAARGRGCPVGKPPAGWQPAGGVASPREDARNLRRSEARNKVLRTCFNTTLISFASAFTLWGLGELQDRRYFQATTIEEGTLRRRLFQVFSIGSMVGAAVGAVSAGVSVTLYAGAR